jgi:hypothetical protein
MDNRRKEIETTGFLQFLQLVLQNVCHFISLSGQPAWQSPAQGKPKLLVRMNWIIRRKEIDTGLLQFLQLVLQNVRHFISLSGQPAWQLAALGKHSVSFTAEPDPTLCLIAGLDPQ